MTLFLSKHLEFLADLVSAKVDFIIIGGYAIIYHGYIRTTGDLDIWLKPDNKNKDKLIPVLMKNGIKTSSIEKVRKLNFTEVVVFHFGFPPEKIDFLTKLTGIEYDEARGRTEMISNGAVVVPILNLDDLIVNKMLSNRAKDLADLEGLQTIKRMKKK